MSVVGARPQFVKLAAIAAAFTETDHKHSIIHTGQHYDHNMSGAFFDDLVIPAPTLNLEVGSSSHGRQTGAMLAALDETFEDLAPDWVLVYGDTNSTLAAAVSAAKMHIKLAHLEAGLRSFNRLMPEEHNRVLTDHSSDLLMAPTEVAATHLRHEGLGSRTVVIGDVMTDVLRKAQSVVDRAPVKDEGAPFVVSTLHRAENTDSPDRLNSILDQLSKSPIEVRLLAHPRLRARAAASGLPLARGAITVHEPVGYVDMVRLMMQSRGVVTDSGGLQKEAYMLERVCTTVRPETEWVETLVDGWNVLDPHAERLSELVARPAPKTGTHEVYGDGHAAEAAIKAMVDYSPTSHDAARA